MPNETLSKDVVNLFRISGYSAQPSVKINHREIDVFAAELQGLTRKKILIECADYSKPVGVGKLQEDIDKLRSAKESLRDTAILMHVSRSGYTAEASGFARDAGIDILTYENLVSRLINFDGYIEAIENEPLRAVILDEYQSTTINPDNKPKSKVQAVTFLRNWLTTDEKWLTVLGDYGVGKSWMLKRLLYELLEDYKKNPGRNPLPFFVPLQRFTKAFDYKNLILATLTQYGMNGLYYDAFEYLCTTGRIVFLLDSFDEMAQSLSRKTIQANLNELLQGVSSNSRAIMTSRPTYFESRAERLLLTEKAGELHWHRLDEEAFTRQTALTRQVREELASVHFARLNDLTTEQRRQLFRVVLKNNPEGFKKLMELFERFQELETISQRAVIARLLTTVAETLALGEEVKTPDGQALIPEDLQNLNQAKVFEIIVYNLLYRDLNIGGLSAADRLRFLKHFAVFLQQPGRSFFSTPREIRNLVAELFEDKLRGVDAKQQELENIYRTCRRHAGLTTEKQFLDTSGNIDLPVEELDLESRVGFSHNSIREVLVAKALADYIENGEQTIGLNTVSFSELVGDFLLDMYENEPSYAEKLKNRYAECTNSNLKEVLLSIIHRFIQKSQKFLELLGTPPRVANMDLSLVDFSGLNLKGLRVLDCIAQDSDFRKTDLRGSHFEKTIIERCLLDGARIEGANFAEAEVTSIYVFDTFDRRTLTILEGKSARQWLFSRGARVKDSQELNRLMGRDWYEAAREVTRTLERRMAGQHQEVGLVKGIEVKRRQLAISFVKYLAKRRILQRIKKSASGDGWVVRVNPTFRDTIHEFSENGVISENLKPFFDRHIQEEAVSEGTKTSH